MILQIGATAPFLRDLAKPTAALDSHAKVRMRSKVRGLRELEEAIYRSEF